MFRSNFSRGVPQIVHHSRTEPVPTEHRRPQTDRPQDMSLALDTQAKESLGFPGLAVPPPIAIECEAFSGSLGALFQCVRTGKVDLAGVPLFPVCEAYFQYLIESSGEDLDSAAAALLALAYLLERKAGLLLPRPESEEEEDVLPDYVEPYAHEYAAAIEALREWQSERESTFFRATKGESYEMPYDVGEVSSLDLARSLERLLRRAKPDPNAMPAKPRRSLAEQMKIVLAALSPEPRPLERIVQGEFTRSEAVWWFLALLELIRLGQAHVELNADDVLFSLGEAS